MRLRLRLLACVAALAAATLAVPSGRSVVSSGDRAAEASAGFVVSPSISVAESVRRPRSDPKVPVWSKHGFLSTSVAGPARYSAAVRDERPDGAVILDGSDRWRSLLLGAPPLPA
jgi:hypothetical protein